MARQCNSYATFPEQSRHASRCEKCCGTGRTHRQPCRCTGTATGGGSIMNNIIYIVGLVVVVLAILSFLGLR
ncbi:MAG: hypothetical protein EOP19_16860 [Hyphomicrobiales bacterium]|nr:MAG: hypothetical protein EOP19_16860 [Hyphomicrobiales bacterium]